MNLNITLVIQGLAFFLVAWLVMKYGWPHILAAISERQKKIADGLAAADRATQELKDADARVADEIRKARTQATEIVDKAHNQASQIVDKAKTDAIAEGNRQKAAAEAEIENLAHRAKEQLRHRVAELAVAGASRIIQREIDANTHKALLDQLVAEI